MPERPIRRIPTAVDIHERTVDGHLWRELIVQEVGQEVREARRLDTVPNMGIPRDAAESSNARGQRIAVRQDDAGDLELQQPVERGRHFRGESEFR